MPNKAIKAVLTGLFILYFFYCVSYLYKNHENQWDFQVGYNCAKVYFTGENPYDPEVMNAQTGNRQTYIFTPATLWFYRLFTLAEYDTAYKIFLFVKTAIVIGLILLWRFKFLKKQGGAGFYFFSFLIFNSAIFLDMRAGNIIMFEQLMIWLGLYFFLKRRLLLFCIFILLGSAFKLTPAVFLILLLLTDNKKRFLYFLGSLAVLAGYLLTQYILQPEMLLAFFKGTKTILREVGIIAPSTVGLLNDLSGLLIQYTAINISQNIQLVIFGFIALVILLISSRAYFKLKSLKTKDKQILTLFLFCFVFALLHIKMKDYAYVLLIAPSYYIINRTSFAKIYPLLFFISILAAARLTLPIFMDIYAIMWGYYPLIIAYFMWGLYLYEIFTLAKQPAEAYTTLNSEQN